MYPVCLTCTRSTGLAGGFRLVVRCVLFLSIGGIIGNCHAVTNLKHDSGALEAPQTGSRPVRSPSDSIVPHRDMYLWSATIQAFTSSTQATSGTEAEVVPRPWWLTSSLRTIAAAALAPLLIGFVGIRIRRVKLQQARERAFSSKLIQSQEDERGRIASELHDSLGQDLLVIKNRALLGLRDAAFSQDPREQLNEISRIASAGLLHVREISYNLRPYQLDRLGLTKALHAMVAKISGASGLNCVPALESLDGLLPPHLDIHLYRIVQELLNNVVKHSHASRAGISAVIQVERDSRRIPLFGSRIRRSLLLQVSDDGCGFDPELETGATPDSAGMGLKHVAERVRILDAEMHCESHRARGTVWTIRVPIKNTVAPR